LQEDDHLATLLTDIEQVYIFVSDKVSALVVDVVRPRGSHHFHTRAQLRPQGHQSLNPSQDKDIFNITHTTQS
jgi:hypothetical protein